MALYVLTNGMSVAPENPQLDSNDTWSPTDPEVASNFSESLKQDTASFSPFLHRIDQLLLSEVFYCLPSPMMCLVRLASGMIHGAGFQKPPACGFGVLSLMKNAPISTQRNP